jgi:hypothetical protein
LTDGALWLETLLACRDLAGALFDRGALRDILIEGHSWFRRDLRTRLRVNKRPLMIERDLREGLACGLAPRDGLV